MTLFKNANIVSDGNIINADLLVKDDKISQIGHIDSDDDYRLIDCKGLYLSAGFIDLHVHGGGGYSAMSQSIDDILKMCLAHAKHGSTSILPSFLSSSVSELKAYAETVKMAKEKSDFSNILGVYFEGPFISKEAAGAQSKDKIFDIYENAAADILSVKNLKMITIAPELPGAMELAKSLHENNIVVSMGHTCADFDTASKALENGFSDMTHIFNACSRYHKSGSLRVAGAAEAALINDNCTVQFIGDLKHIPAGLIKLIYKCKGAKNSYLITDGLEFSASDLKERQKIKQKNGIWAVCNDGVMKTEDMSALAGSISSMDILVKNLYKTVGISLMDAITMATSTPARVIGIDDKLGYIRKNYIADIVIFDENIDIKYVMVKGKLIKEAQA